MQLAKQHLDIGLFTTQRDDQIAFWSETVGLSFDHMAKLGGGIQQHRFLALGTPDAAIVKVNHARDGLEHAPPSGLSELFIARAGTDQPRRLSDPDSNAVSIVPPGHRGIGATGITLSVNDVPTMHTFYVRALGFTPVAADTLRCGATVLFLRPSERRIEPSAYRAPGWRYMTIQVTQCDTVHAAALRAGATEGRAPSTLGTTARISFVRDPDGTWIEISERASLTLKPLGD